MTTRPRIPVAGPSITELEIASVAAAVRDGWQDRAGSYQRVFEEKFASYVGRDHAICLPSCTSAIHLTLAALGFGPGDEVIVPDITWIATAAPISYVGARAVFADVDRATWCLAPSAFERCIGPRTRAVIAVDLYGGMPDYDAIIALADRHDIAVIEDAAQAIGATYCKRRAGSFGRASVFSFHGSKTLTTGEGGMLVTDDRALYERALILRDHGRKPGDRWFHNENVAFKYRMSDLQAALGIAQLQRVDELVAKKRQIFKWYTARLTGLNGVSLNPECNSVEPANWMTTIMLDPALELDKRALMDALNRAGIETRPFFHPLSSLPAYENDQHALLARKRNQTAHAIAPYGVNLPSGLQLTESDIEYVCNALRKIITGLAARRQPAAAALGSGCRSPATE